MPPMDSIIIEAQSQPNKLDGWLTVFLPGSAGTRVVHESYISPEPRYRYRVMARDSGTRPLSASFRLYFPTLRAPRCNAFARIAFALATVATSMFLFCVSAENLHCRGN